MGLCGNAAVIATTGGPWSRRRSGPVMALPILRRGHVVVPLTFHMVIGDITGLGFGRGFTQFLVKRRGILGPLEPFWGHLVLILGHLGPNRGASWGILGTSWSRLGVS